MFNDFNMLKTAGQPIKAYLSDLVLRDVIFIKAYVIDKCNYNCPYCYNKKPRTGQQLDLNVFFKFIQKIHQLSRKKIEVELIGGEPTLHPGLIDFCDKLSRLDFIYEITIYSNFQGDLTTYFSLASLPKIELFLSWHGLKLDRFNKSFYINACKLKNILKSEQFSKISFNIMAEQGNIKNALMIYNLLYVQKLNVSIAGVGQLDKINSVGRYQYSSIDLQNINKFMEITNKHSSLDITVEFENNVKQKMSINEMMWALDMGLLSFNGWHCMAGINRFYIHSNANAYSCQQDYENGYDPIYSLMDKVSDKKLIMDKPCICKNEVCICESFVEKWK